MLTHGFEADLAYMYLFSLAYNQAWYFDFGGGGESYQVQGFTYICIGFDRLFQAILITI